ncbi:MAG: hypothetical protein LQ348_004297 [Seirophora lacunosa]|nr:MAG: hypothetical protein LQ348_004297 [Seirophora lacunosa]
MSPKKPVLTHFLCLPLTTHSASQWLAALQHFTADIQALQPPKSCAPPTSGPPAAARSIPIKAIRPLGTLHLTIGVMSLTKPEQLDAAVELLRGLDIGSMLAKADERHDSEQSAEVRPAEMNRKGGAESTPKISEDEPLPPSQSSSPDPLTLSFTGLKSMRSPASTSFLYVPPGDTSGRLYPFCRALKDRFTHENLMVEEARAMKLHATVLNTIYAGKVYPSKRPAQAEGPAVEDVENDHGSEGAHDEEGHATGEPIHEDHDIAEQNGAKSKGTRPDQSMKKKGKRRKQAVQFDARDLLERYVDFEWARDVRVEKVAICEMGAKKIVAGYGEVVGEEYTEIASRPSILPALERINVGLAKLATTVVMSMAAVAHSLAGRSAPAPAPDYSLLGSDVDAEGEEDVEADFEDAAQPSEAVTQGDKSDEDAQMESEEEEEDDGDDEAASDVIQSVKKTSSRRARDSDNDAAMDDASEAESGSAEDEDESDKSSSDAESAAAGEWEGGSDGGEDASVEVANRNNCM